MLYNLVHPLSKFLKPKKKTRIYSNVFNLHGKLTVGLLLLFSVIVSVKEYFGEPIYCMTQKAEYKTYAENYCWTHGTFIQKRYLNGKFRDSLILMPCLMLIIV
ncbi:Innexin [Sergentomyia squamirostris]